MGDHLGSLEELTLLALLKLRDDAYGVTIRRALADATRRDISLGAVYSTLERLEQKGYVSSRFGGPLPERGGKARRYFKIEAPGSKALRQKEAIVARLKPGLASA